MTTRESIDPAHARNREIASSKLAHTILRTGTLRQFLEERSTSLEDVFLADHVHGKDFRQEFQRRAGLPVDGNHYSTETWEAALEKVRIAWAYADSLGGKAS